MSKLVFFIFGLVAILLFASCTAAEATSGAEAPTAAAASKEEPAAPDGNTYHVAANGNDTNAGGEAAPWATLQHAVDSVQPGDLILIHAGTYAGARIELSGTDAAPITLRASAGESVLINQPGPNNRHDSNLELETWEGDGMVAYWVIEGLEVAGAPNWGIDVRGSETAHSHHITIRANVVHDNGWTGGDTGIFAAFTDDVLIENNASYHNGEHGIYVNNSSDRFIIRGNRVYSNVNCGIHLNGDLESGGDGVMTDGLVENNSIYENGSGGGAGINMDGVSDSVVLNNLLYQNHASGIALFQENGAECSQNNRIWHNTILMPDDGRWAVIIASPDCIDNQIYNNIFYSEHSYRGSINIPASSVTGLASDYNIVVDRFTTDDGDSILTLAEWQALGYDVHSFIAAPAQLFVNAAGQNFHLFAGSAAVDQGYTISAVSADLESNPRPVGNAPDTGAYEYQGSSGDETIYLPLVTTSPNPLASGHIYYTLGDDSHLYRLDVNAPDTPQDLTAALGSLASGSDEWANISPDGDWVLLSTERGFHTDCAGWACLVLLPSDLSSGEALLTPNGVIHTEGFSAVASGGNLVVYVGNDGPHTLDLWAVTRQGGGWSAPVLLTAASSYDAHTHPALSADGSKVLFNCDPDLQDGQQGTAICEVYTDGSNFRTVIAPIDGPDGTAANALHHPDYAPDGSIVFEADWQGEQIWLLPVGSSTPTRVSDAFNNDNSPCVLPDGRIASLWLDRPGGQGYHELKIMLSDGSDYFMAFTDLDVFDIGLGCGE
ncbi:MAG: right-handed parallel beta-helix repeat-containing protein [Chloroflexi bacterium]|nr:right-handed parallel beta-helix repeat-containing protein [Chloroflexota bacterium]